MNNLYVCKVSDYQALGNQIDIPKRVAIDFFNIPEEIINDGKNANITICHYSNLEQFKDIEIQTATNVRLSTILNTFLSENFDSITQGCLLLFEKLGRLFCVRTIKKGESKYDALTSLFEENEKHMLLSSNLGTQNKNEEKKTKYPLQQIFYGAPGTGKSYIINNITEEKDVIRTTFHPDTDYSTFVGSYKPTTIDAPVMTVIGTKAAPVENPDGSFRTESKIVYEFVSQAFLHAYIEAWKKYATPNGEGLIEKQYLVIEEINRGNCAQIFGDLFQLLDRNDKGFSDYPIKADADMAKQLRKQFEGLVIENSENINALYKGKDIVNQVLNGDILLLPNNLYIWATMNTSDQSLFPIDSAFKRRWDWQYMPIADGNKNWRIEVNGLLYDWWDFLEKINFKIGLTTNSEDKKLGYYFCKPNYKNINAKTFVGKVIFYLWNDVFKDYDLEGELFNDEDNSKLTFDKFYSVQNDNVNINERKVELFLRNLRVEPLDEEVIDYDENDEEIKEENDDDNKKRKTSHIEIFFKGKQIEGKSSIAKFANLIEEIGVEDVAALGIKAIKKSSIDLLSKTRLPEDTPGGYGENMRQIDGYWMATKYNNDAKISMINEIADRLQLDIKVEII